MKKSNYCVIATSNRRRTWRKPWVKNEQELTTPEKQELKRIRLGVTS